MKNVISRGRGNQPLWVWLAVLTAHNGLCTYCADEGSVTLEHEVPLADKGRDIWWNLVPACDRCNWSKGAKTATEWKVEMEMAYQYPGAGFTKPKLPLEAVLGIRERVAKVQRQIQESARLQWFEHHYGDERKPRLRREIHERLELCVRELERYRFPPWTYPEVRESSNRCTRRVCCGWTSPDAWWEFIILPEEYRERAHQAAYDEGLYIGDFLGEAVKNYLADRQQRK
ncbi:HNH endonuclease [Streptomyces syringium]|uniref:HNH endonuclease n=1 Tax=Streptomyces syringium TaxID=76729 RepID=UPI0033F7A0EF